MWKTVNNSNEEKPLEIEYCEGVYYARTNFRLKEDDEHKYWQYEEKEIPEREYSEINVLNEFLSKTDYIWNVIKEGDHGEEYYADVIANRHTWRMRIRELEGE